MSVSIHGLRREAALLSARIETAETTARHARGIAAITPQPEVAATAIDHAVRAERAALVMASRLSRIARTIGDYF